MLSLSRRTLKWYATSLGEVYSMGSLLSKIDLWVLGIETAWSRNA